MDTWVRLPPAPPKRKNDMTRVNIDVREWTEREPEPDGWDNGDSWGEVTRVYISDSDYNWSYRGKETDLVPPFYVVYAEYGTGGTFGREFEACVVAIVKDVDEADRIADKAREAKGYDIEGTDFYIPWNGYFESLSAVHVERIS